MWLAVARQRIQRLRGTQAKGGGADAAAGKRKPGQVAAGLHSDRTTFACPGMVLRQFRRTTGDVKSRALSAFHCGTAFGSIRFHAAILK